MTITIDIPFQHQAAFQLPAHFLGTIIHMVAESINAGLDHGSVRVDSKYPLIGWEITK